MCYKNYVILGDVVLLMGNNMQADVKYK
jgi:hypothetical protein